MTQRQALLDLFKANGNRLTLGQIMGTTLAAEYRARMTELRQEGYSIVCKTKPGSPSENLYTLTEPPTAPLYYTEPHSQQRGFILQ